MEGFKLGIPGVNLGARLSYFVSNEIYEKILSRDFMNRLRVWGRNLDFILWSDTIKGFYHAKEFGFLPKGFRKCDGEIFACGR